MTRLAWGDPAKRFFDTGLDRGVLYPKNRLPAEIAATNMNPNPSIEIDTTGYDGAAGDTSLTRDTSWSASGTASLGVNVTPGVVNNNTKAFIGAGPGGLRLGMQAGKTYTVTAVVNTPVAQTGSVHSAARRILAFVKDSAGTTTMTQSNQGPVTGVGRVRVTFDIPVGSTEAYVALYNGSDVDNEKVQWDDIAVYEGSVAVPYFDGNTSNDGLYTYEWSGITHASTSIKRNRPNTAVPWDGLTNVEETGADSATAYYVDGRPFLFLPKPKEFQATIKAMTYPDAFAEIMGLVEAVDGMYLDSQQGDSFDMCYRTQVGNGVDGGFGYKIHLIYNATVAPQGIAYQTNGNSINPVEFGWDIQAVPVVVPGYRPTAHIVIDTRHMDHLKLAKIESLLYGDEATIARMPSPTTILDLLSYGDTIVIKDLGNGEWEAVGSYHNIYLIGDGVFEIDNANAVVYTDGSYDLASTDEVLVTRTGIMSTVAEPID